MKRCLDEATLQSYFDGELSTDQMESATFHLASCSACAAAARELEEEVSLLTTALATEFDAPVPTEQLRHRISAAVANLDAPIIVHKSGFLGSVSRLLSFAPQQALAYGGLILVLAFAAVFGILKMRSQTSTPAIAEQQTPSSAHNNDAVAKAVQKESPEPDIPAIPVPQPDRHPTIKPVSFSAKTVTPKPAPPVKLLPGERSYLQTIARLDTAIKAGKKSMRPALQVEYERNLAVVDRAIAATRTAAKSNPNDPDAADFMFAAYQSKVDFLNTIADARVGGRSH